MGELGNIEVPGRSKHNLVLRGGQISKGQTWERLPEIWGTPGDFTNSTWS